MLRIPGASLLVLSLLSLAACGGGPAEQPAVDPATWCEDAVGGPSGTRALAADLSAAHADVRFFGAELDGGSADVALAQALEAPTALTDGGIAAALTAYKSSLLNVCVLPADDTAVPAAQVEMKGAVAVIHPGTGEVSVPAEAAGVAIDLRGLPNRDDLEPALQAAVSAALAEPSHRGAWLIRSNLGLPAELAAYQGIYVTGFDQLNPEPFEGAAARDYPLVVITGPKLAPAAARVAAELRLGLKAWIVGEGVRVAVAESCWQGVGNTGIAYRCRELSSGRQRWADVIPADYPLEKLDSVLQELPSLGTPEMIPSDASSLRPFLEVGNPTARPEPTTASLGDVRAALITAHGAIQRFFPYDPPASDAVDARLSEVLEGLGDTPDRSATLDALRRLSQVLGDGQAFASDLKDVSTAKLPLVLDQVGGEPVVRASGDPQVHPGDRITAVDGVAFADWYQGQASLLSASTEPYRLQRSFERLIQRPSAQLTLVDANGASRQVTVAAQDDATFTSTRKSAMRASGLLPGTNVFYLDADASRLADLDAYTKLLQQADGADGLILDLRGVTAVSPYALAAGIVTHNFNGPLFNVPTWLGPQTFALSPAQNAQPASTFAFGQKVAVLIGPSTVADAALAATAIQDGVAEDTSPDRVQLVGRPTAGTSGTVSVLNLPGGFAFGFTGMEMFHADGTTPFQGVGLSPDVSAPPTQADLANGVDTELQAALTALSAN